MHTDVTRFSIWNRFEMKSGTFYAAIGWAREYNMHMNGLEQRKYHRNLLSKCSLVSTTTTTKQINEKPLARKPLQFDAI